jgi:hypothetical protein
LDTTTFFGILRITWDGLGSAGETMPADFDRVKVYASTNSGFAPSSFTYVDDLLAAGKSDIPGVAGVIRYVKFVAVDKLGNESVPSDEASGSTRQVVSQDILDGVIAAAKIADGTITALKIANDTITAAQLAPDSITAAELANGAVDSGAIQAFAVGTAALADAAVATAKIADNAISTAKIQADAITAVQIASNAVGTAEIAVASVTASKVGFTVGGGNLVSNSNMEGGISPWNEAMSNGTVALDTGVQYQGSQSIKCTQTLAGTTARVGQNATHVLVPPSTPIVMSAYFRPDGYARTPGLYWSYYDAAGALIASYQGNATTDFAADTWSRHVYSHVTPANAASVMLRFQMAYGATWPSNVNNVGDSFHVDAVQIEVGDVATAYAPRVDEILPGTITTTQIADNSITTPKIVAGAVVTGSIAAGAITATQIAADTITSAQIAAGAIAASEIAAGAVTSEKLTVGSMTDNILLNPAFEEVSAADPTMAANWARPGSPFSPNVVLTTVSPISGSQSMKLTPIYNLVMGVGVGADNVSFEGGVGDWQGSSATRTSSTTAGVVDGTHALAVTSTGVSQDCYAVLNLGMANMSAGSTYTIAGSVTLTAAQTGGLDARARSIQLYYYNGATLIGGDVSNQAANVAGTTRVAKTFTIPANCTNVQVRLYNGSATAGNVVYWDAIQVEVGTVANTFSNNSGVNQFAIANALLYPAPIVIPAVQGDVYYLSFSAKGSVAGCSVQALVFNGALTASLVAIPATTVSTTATRYEGTFTVPAGYSTIVPIIYALSSGTIGGSVTIDDVQLRRVVVSAQIADGAIIAPKIAAGAITAEKLTVGSLSSSLIANGSFGDTPIGSTIPVGWTSDYERTGAGGSFSQDIYNPRSGGAAGVTGLAAPADGSSIASSSVAVNEGDVISIRGFLRPGGVLGTTFYVRALFGFVKDFTRAQVVASAPTHSTTIYPPGMNGGSNQPGYSDISFGTPTTWNTYQEIAGTVTVPTGASWMRLVLYTWTSPTAGARFGTWDDWEVRKVVVSAQIADGAITTPKIQAGSVTAEKLTVGSLGDSLVPNGSFEDQGTAVDNIEGVGGVFNAARWSGVASAGCSAYTEANSRGSGQRTAVLHTTGPGVESRITTDYIPVSKSAKYFFSAGAVQTGAAVGGFYLRVFWYKQDKTPSAVLAYADVASNVTLPTSTTIITTTAGHVTSGQLVAPSDAAYAAVRFYNSSPSSDTYVIIDNVEMRAVTVSAMIADGAITTPKIVAGAITAASGIIADATISTAKIQDGAILTAKIGDAQIVTAKIQDLGVTTAKIADLQVVNAKIGSLAVNDAKIGDVSVGKLTAGILTADITVSARIKTANSGARVEINSSGLQAYNSGGTQTVSISAFDGSATFVGTLSTGFFGARWAIGSNATNTITAYTGDANEQTPGTIVSTAINPGTGMQPYLWLNAPTFYPGETAANLALIGKTAGGGQPSQGVLHGDLAALTTTAGGGITCSQTQTYLYGPSFASGITLTNSADVQIGQTILVNNQWRVGDQSVVGNTGSTHIAGSSTGLRLAVASTDFVDVKQMNSITTWRTIRALSFPAQSTEASKTDIAKHGYGLSHLKNIKPVKFKRKSAPENGVVLGVIAEEIAQFIPEAAVYHTESKEQCKANGVKQGDLFGVDPLAIISVCISALQEADDRISRLEEMVKR